MAMQLMMKSKDKKYQEKEYHHWVWPENVNEAYCGKDVTNEIWLPDGTPITCPECLIIEEICLLDEMMENNGLNA